MPATDRPRGFMVWVGDFLSDPNVASMSTVEVGAFWLLLLYAAQTGGSLPNDDRLLARYARLKPGAWKKHREAVLRAWVVTPEAITQKRLQRELESALRRREDSSRAANSRWHTHRTHASALPGQCQEEVDKEKEEPTNAATPRPSSNDHEANQRGVLGLLGGMADRLAMPNTDATKNQPTKPAWDWLTANATAEEARRGMAFVGWLMKTGTKDPEALLALVKHYVVHRPDNPHAYYTPLGAARTVVVMGSAADKAVAEHERIKREEMAFLRRGK